MKNLILLIVLTLITSSIIAQTNKEGKKDGLRKVFYENGQLKEEFNYKEGKKDGLRKAYYENGKLRLKTNYKNDKLDGLFELFYENGQLRVEFNYKEGKKDGLRNEYHENGQLKEEFNYKEGKKDGLRKAYYENGKLRLKTNYKNDKLDGILMQYTSLGILFWKENFKDGKKDGLDEWYDSENGQLETRTNYKNGEFDAFIDGVFTYNFGNSQKISTIETYKDGKKDGLEESFYENGQLEYQKNYKDGKEDGLFEGFYENGQLKFKLLFKNGYFKTNLRKFIGGTNIEDVNVYDLEAMIKLFLKDCKINNIKLLSDYKITSTFETLDKGKVALSYGIFNDKEIIIRVSPQEWSKASNPKRWYILYHELGHDVLNLKHGQGGKMMFNFTEEDYDWNDLFVDKDYMFNSMKR